MNVNKTVTCCTLVLLSFLVSNLAMGAAPGGTFVVNLIGPAQDRFWKNSGNNPRQARVIVTPANGNCESATVIVQPGQFLTPVQVSISKLSSGCTYTVIDAQNNPITQVSTGCDDLSCKNLMLNAGAHTSFGPCWIATFTQKKVPPSFCTVTVGDFKTSPTGEYIYTGWLETRPVRTN